MVSKLLAWSALDIVNDWMHTNPPQTTTQINIESPRARELIHKALWALTSSPGHNTPRFVFVLKRRIRTMRLQRSQPLTVDDKAQCKFIEQELVRHTDKDDEHRRKAETEALRLEYAAGYTEPFAVAYDLLLLHKRMSELIRLKRGLEAQYDHICNENKKARRAAIE
jgi:hypothetical protein